MMDAKAHDRYAASFQRYFLDEMPAQERREFRDHVRDCETCRESYERWAAAENALDPAPSGGLSSSSLERGQAAVLGREEAARPSRLGPWAAGIGALAALIIAVIAVPRSDDGFTPRGGDSVVDARIGFRVLVARSLGGSPQVSDLASGDGQVEDGDRLKLLYSSVGAPSVLEVQLLDEHGRRVEEIAGRRAVVDGALDVAIGGTVDVDASWPVGRLYLVARFASDESSLSLPLSAQAIDAPGLWTRVVSFEKVAEP